MVSFYGSIVVLDVVPRRASLMENEVVFLADSFRQYAVIVICSSFGVGYNRPKPSQTKFVPLLLIDCPTLDPSSAVVSQSATGYWRRNLSLP